MNAMQNTRQLGTNEARAVHWLDLTHGRISYGCQGAVVGRHKLLTAVFEVAPSAVPVLREFMALIYGATAPAAAPDAP